MTVVALRLLTTADLPFADSLRALAGWNQTREDWQRFLDISPEGCLLAECEGKPAGVVTTISYGQDVGWIGMMLVHPDFRRRGIGSVLMRHAIEVLRSQKVKCIKLDATPDGRLVYLKLGFQDEFQLTRYVGGPFPSGETVEGSIDPADAVEWDRRAIGFDRSVLLKRLIEASPRVADSDAGFGLLRRGSNATYLGPVVGSPDLANSLIAGQSKIYCDIPDSNRAMRQWAEAHGFVAQRTLTRMFLGQNIVGSAPELLCAIAAPELG